MRYAIRLSAAAVALTALTSCGSPGLSGKQNAPIAVDAAPLVQDVRDEPVTLGVSYTVGPMTYTPQDTPQYDEVGYAGSLAPELAGGLTVNGEKYSRLGASAAHKTLPIPSYVEVTSLASGRTILVRINDRGPMVNDRLIDLSESAAEQLGLDPQGVAAVRVRRVNPPEQEKFVLRQGMTAAERIETPDSLLKILRDKLANQQQPSSLAQKHGLDAGKTERVDSPTASGNHRLVREGGKALKPRATVTLSPPKSNDFVAQIGAFASRARADALASRTGANVVPSGDGRVFRVRFGPYATEAEATDVARQKGYPQARVYRD